MRLRISPKVVRYKMISPQIVDSSVANEIGLETYQHLSNKFCYHIVVWIQIVSRGVRLGSVVAGAFENEVTSKIIRLPSRRYLPTSPKCLANPQVVVCRFGSSR